MEKYPLVPRIYRKETTPDTVPSEEVLHNQDVTEPTGGVSENIETEQNNALAIAASKLDKISQPDFCDYAIRAVTLDEFAKILRQGIGSGKEIYDVNRQFRDSEQTKYATSFTDYVQSAKGSKEWHKKIEDQTLWPDSADAITQYDALLEEIRGLSSNGEQPGKQKKEEVLMRFRQKVLGVYAEKLEEISSAMRNLNRSTQELVGLGFSNEQIQKYSRKLFLDFDSFEKETGFSQEVCKHAVKLLQSIYPINNLYLMRKIPADALQSLANFYDQEDWIVQAGNTKKLLTSLVFLKHYTAPSSSPDQPYHVAVAVDSRIVGRHQSHNAHFRGWGQIDKNSGDGSDNQVLAAITLSNDPAIREKVRDLVLHAGEAACPVFDMNGNVGWPKVPYVVGDIHEKLKLHLSQSESIPNQHFLEGVEKENLQIGGKSSEQLLMGLETGGVTLDEELKGILLNKRKFIPTRSPENITLVRLSVADLGFEDGATTLEIYERAYELGLELCQPDTAPTYAVSPNPNIPLFSIRSSGVKFGMKPLGDSKTRLAVFNLMRLESGIHLKLETAPSQREWHETSEWYFCLRKTLST